MKILIVNNETWLICGGRHFADQAMFDDVMDRLTDMWGCPTRIVHGGATGADAMAAEWADRTAISCVAMPADWEQYGNAAGPIRNDTMLQLKPKRVIAFPGGKGTADMVRQAKKRRGEIDVVEIKPATND